MTCPYVIRSYTSMRKRPVGAKTAERRAEELRSGQVKGIPADEVFAKARRRLGYLKAWVSRFNSVTSSASVGR
jgi:hypothetical protein